MNLHVASNSPDTLIFNIPITVASSVNVEDILIDTYVGFQTLTSNNLKYFVHYEITPSDPIQTAESLRKGLTIDDKLYETIVPTPSTLEASAISPRTSRLRILTIDAC
ncbi:hypothetical protein BGZ96_002094 [Linnemannia gamsii]|uniref:Uncharacterized protein n=1 Tax=Linnemannia gamsii TaxID=64522 RepID=A0ABQ7JL49_9FUNG|nr:hypothetical protein BGZ96_002094 [Linnemannia gamsii]